MPAEPSAVTTRDAFQHWLDSHDTTLLNGDKGLIAKYRDKAERMGTLVAKRHSSNWNIEDVKAYALVGLWQAFETYVPSKGKFLTWVWTKVRSHVLEGLRSMNETRKLRGRSKVSFTAIEDEEGIEEKLEALWYEHTTHEAIVAATEKEKLLTMLVMLPPREKIAVMELSLKGTGWKKVTKILGVSRARIYGLRKQAIVRMRNWWNVK